MQYLLLQHRITGHITTFAKPLYAPPVRYIQMKTMMTEVDKDGHTLLAMAASSGNKYTFNAVLAAVTEELGQAEVRLSISGLVTLYSISYNIFSFT